MRRSTWPATGTARSTPRSHREPRSAIDVRTYDREPGWFPLIAGRFARGCCSFRYVDGIDSGLDSPRDDWESTKTKVMARGPLSSRVGCAEALLSFRYVDGIDSGLDSPPRRLGVEGNKVMAGGPRQALLRW